MNGFDMSISNHPGAGTQLSLYVYAHIYIPFLTRACWLVGAPAVRRQLGYHAQRRELPERGVSYGLDLPMAGFVGQPRGRLQLHVPELPNALRGPGENQRLSTMHCALLKSQVKVQSI